MNTEKLLVADPYNEEHIRLFNEFEKINDIKTKTTNFLESIKSKFTKEDYAKYMAESNEIHQSVFAVENKKVKDSCHIRAEKDIKMCELFFAPLKSAKNRKREILQTASDYAFNRLNMEEIFVSIDYTDKNLKDNLEAFGYESLGDVNGKLTYMKEKEESEEASIAI